MKAISLLQPWATLVVLGAKPYDTRTWETRHRGTLAIHASKRFPEECRELCCRPPHCHLLQRAGYRSWFDLPTGVILGTVHLLACVRSDELDGQECNGTSLGDYRPGPWVWRLELPTLFATPIPFRGRPGLFEVAYPSTTEWPHEIRNANLQIQDKLTGQGLHSPGANGDQARA
jgi:hypothetical protein